MAAFVGGGLSLIGVPLTAGFISKWYRSSRHWKKDGRIVLLIVVSSLIAVVYVFRVIEAAYFRCAGRSGKCC